MRLGVVMASGSLLLAAHSRVYAYEYGLELNAGQVKVTDTTNVEIDKKGSVYGGSIFYRSAAPGGNWQVALGLLSGTIEGKSTTRGIKQDFQLTAPYLDAQYLLTIADGFGAGLALREQYGQGTRYDPRDPDAKAAVLSGGVVLRYSYSAESYKPQVSLGYYADLNNKDRQVRTLLVGIGLAIPVASSAEPEPATPPPVAKVEAPPPPPEPAPVAPPPPPAPVVVNLDAKAIAFQHAKFTPDKPSMARIKRIAKALTQFDGAWESLEISGHTDASGHPDRNIALSEKRANAVCDALVEGGVQRAKLSCKGYGQDRPLPGLEPDAPAHRRVEMAFQGIKPEQSQALSEAITQALK